MKTLFIACICSVVLAGGLFAQSPTITPQATAAISPAAAVTVSPSPAEKDDLETRIEKKLKKRFNVTIGDDDIKVDGDHDAAGDMGELVAIPIIAIVFTTIFGAPVLIVGVILFMNYLKARSLHRTVRTMVEKGQPVPAELFAGPGTPRPRSDMRRGIVLVMVGIGLMIFLGAVNGWEGSAWSLGVIPFLIGCGYLIVWQLEGKKDNPPPVP